MYVQLCTVVISITEKNYQLHSKKNIEYISQQQQFKTPEKNMRTQSTKKWQLLTQQQWKAQHASLKTLAQAY